MLGGRADTALQHAQELLDAAAKAKRRPRPQ
jgi:hypothetical protein